MRLQEIGYQIRQARLARNMTQATLAEAAGLSRTTLNQLENGLFPDLGVMKLQRLLQQVGLTLTIQAFGRPEPDYLEMAATSASVSYRTTLTEDELIRALLTGKPPEGKQAHLRTLFDESRPALLKTMVAEVSRWSDPGRIRKNLTKLVQQVGASRSTEEWITLD